MIPEVKKRGLVFVPTYNERDNVEGLINELVRITPGFEYLFLDDNSPDGTGELLDQLAMNNPRLHVIHRQEKLGIGSAHVDGIRWAYDNQYSILITMDSDFSHSPSHILKLLEYADTADVVIGSRFLQKDSLSEWSLLRKALTYTGHITTKLLLNMPFDATGAFRLYRIDKIAQTCFDIESSNGYSFFFESLFILFKNHYKIKEIAIDLPARTYGHSKMKFRDASNSLTMLGRLLFLNVFTPEVFRVNKNSKGIRGNDKVKDDQGWDDYWEKQRSVNNWFYDRIAEIFRQFIIKPYLNRYVFRLFPKGATLLHAGCGSGQVDIDITKKYSVTALDISLNALRIYQQIHPKVHELIQSDMRNIDLEDGTFDGIYSLGVLEHFYEADILLMLKEFQRVLKSGGKAVIFWPPTNSLSVLILGLWHFIINKVLRRRLKLHPTEVSLLRSRQQALDLADRTGLKLLEYHFGIDDLFTQVVIVLEKNIS